MKKVKYSFKPFIKKLIKKLKLFFRKLFQITTIFIKKIGKITKFIKSKIPRWKESIVSRINESRELERHEKIYRYGFLLTIVTFVIYMFFSPSLIDISTENDKGIILPINKIYFIGLGLVWLTVITFTYGYVLEKITKLEKLEKQETTKVSKTLIGIIVSSVIFTVYVLSEILIGHSINDYVDIDPSYFSDARVAMKLAFVPYLWLWVAMIYLFLELNFLLLKSMFNMPKWSLLIFSSSIIPSKKGTEKLKEMSAKDSENMRSSFIIFMPIILVGAILSSSYIPYLKNLKLKEIPLILFIQSEYYPSSYCANLKDKNILVADIGGGLYSVYNPQSKKTKKFTVSKCEVELTKHTVK
jgi:hypothetical protein